MTKIMEKTEEIHTQLILTCEIQIIQTFEVTPLNRINIENSAKTSTNNIIISVSKKELKTIFTNLL